MMIIIEVFFLNQHQTSSQICFNIGLRSWLSINPQKAKLNNLNFHQLKLGLATAIHNFKRAKITHICLMWDRIWADLNI